MLDKSKLGRKYTCFKCSCKFYDLNRKEPLCPRCGADQREDPNPDPRDAFLAKYRWAAPEPEPEEPEKDEPDDDFEDDLMDDEDIDELVDPGEGDDDTAPGKKSVNIDDIDDDMDDEDPLMATDADSGIDVDGSDDEVDPADVDEDEGEEEAPAKKAKKAKKAAKKPAKKPAKKDDKKD